MILQPHIDINTNEKRTETYALEKSLINSRMDLEYRNPIYTPKSNYYRN